MVGKVLGEVSALLFAKRCQGWVLNISDSALPFERKSEPKDRFRDYS